MPFAVSDVVWQALIAGAVTVVLAYMNQRTKNAVVKTAADATVERKEVKNTLAAVEVKQDRHAASQEAKMSDLVNHTNGIKDELVAEVRKASFAEGEKSQKDKESQRPPTHQ